MMFEMHVCTWANGRPIVEERRDFFANFSNFLEEPRQVAKEKGVDYVIEVWDDGVKLGYIGVLPSGKIDAHQLVDDCEHCYGDGQERGILCGDGCCTGPTGNECPSCDGKGYELREGS